MWWLGAAAWAGDLAIGARGTELVLTTPDGRTLGSHDLVGATLHHDGLDVRIDAVVDDVGGKVVLHHLLVVEADGATRELCDPDPQGQRYGFPVPDEAGGFTLTCTSGAIGKCIRWGYRPWEEVPGGPPLHALHAACVRMTRADYGGDGAPHTRPGIRIDFCDRFGIQTCEDGPPVEFEAAWNPDGAVCVARTRVPELATLDQLATSYPRLRDHLGPDACRPDTDALLIERVSR